MIRTQCVCVHEGLVSEYLFCPFTSLIAIISLGRILATFAELFWQEFKFLESQVI